MNSKIYKQADSRWGSLPYPVKRYSFAGNGCGCCAVTHVLIELDKYKNYTPKTVRPYMVKKGYATYGNGTTWAGITATLKHYGFKTQTHDTMADLFKTLDKRDRKWGILLFSAGSRGGVTWTSGGHYVAFTDYKKKNGKHYFYCKDSGFRNHDGWYCYETTMRGLIPQVWSAYSDKPLVKKSTAKKTTKKKKSITQIAKEVIAGKWGNGETRKKRLTKAGYNYAKVQKEVNRLMR